MALIKETAIFNFSQGLDTIDDPNQLSLGKFTSLTNSVFIKSSSGEIGSLKKRNGYAPLTATVSTVSFITNYAGALIGLGQGSLQQYSSNANAWINQGYYAPLNLSTLSLVKNAFSQTQQDSVVAPNGIGCVAYNSGNPSNPYQYLVYDSSTGQVVAAPASLPVVASTTFVTGQPKVFTLGSSFFITYGAVSSGLSISQLVVSQVSTNAPFALTTTTPISQSLYTSNISYIINSVISVASTALFDGTIASNSIFLSFLTGTSLASNVGLAKVSPTLSVSSSILAIGSYSSTCIGNCFDPINSTIYTCIGSAMTVTYLASNYNFAQVFSPSTAAISSSSVNYAGDNRFAQPGIGIINITGIASGGQLQSFYEMESYFFFASTNLSPVIKPVRADNIIKRPVTNIGVIGSESIVGPELGLASKPFNINNQIYLFGSYQSTLQSTYFLLNSSGSIASKFAYGNGGGYYYSGLPSVSLLGQSAAVSYLQKDLLVPIASGVVGSNSQIAITNPYYSQNGINLGIFSFSTSSVSARQTGNTLSLSGGFLWNYDGLSNVENNFFVYPEAFGFAGVGGAHNITQQVYQYQVLYESTDAQGNIYQSAPAIGNSIDASSISSGSTLVCMTSTPQLTLRDSKSPIKISLYRWSQAQPIFYKVGSYIYTGQLTLGTVTPTCVVIQQAGDGQYIKDSLFFNDWSQDSDILGNQILYTTGNVAEDTGAPSFISTDVWDERLWGISAEDNSLWYSKQLVVATPVEMVENFTLYVPPIQTSQGTAQKPLCLVPMDDKQIIFCKSAILYINGNGPDNTGANSQYSEPTQVPSQVGCSNQNSIVQTPNGIMFQSDNGIWLLGRDLQVRYIGKDVEAYNSAVVVSACCIPGTTEVRFSLNTGDRIVYDLLTDQWATFTGLPVASETIYSGLDTILSGNTVYQETPNLYLDGTNPVTMGFTTGWINLGAALQGYVRAYWLDILATFKSPHTYTIGIAYDYNPAIVQTTTINPQNIIGSGSQVSQWEVAFNRPQCQSFQLTFTEVSSSTAGAGLMVSGISITYGKKKSWPRNIAPQNKI